MTGEVSHGPLVSALPLGVTVLDERGTILTANEAAARLLGTDRALLLGRNFFAEFASLEGMGEAHDGFRRGIQQDSIDLRLDTVAASPGQDGSSRLRVRVRSFRDGSDRRALVLLEETGAPGGQELLQAMEVASKVKHEVNNLLMGLLGNLTLLRDRTDLPEAIRKKVELIEQQGKRICDLVADLDAIQRLGGAWK